MKAATTEISIIERAQVALNSSATEKELAALSVKFKDIVVVKDKDQRADCHSALMEVKKARTGIESTGKTARDDANKFSKAVIAEEKRLITIVSAEEDRLAKLRDDYDQALAKEAELRAEEERQRIQAVRDQITKIRNTPAQCVNQDIAELRITIDSLQNAPLDADYFGELILEAKIAHKEMIESLDKLLAQKIADKEEAERREAERMRLAEQAAAQAQVAAEQAAAAQALADKQAELDKREAEIVKQNATSNLLAAADKMIELGVVDASTEAAANITATEVIERQEALGKHIKQLAENIAEPAIDRLIAHAEQFQLPTNIELYTYLHTCTMNHYSLNKAQAKAVIVEMAKAMKI